MHASPSATKVLFIAPSAYTLSGMATWLDYLMPGLARQGWSPVLGLVSGVFHDVARYLAVHPWAPVVSIPNPTGSAEGRIRALVKVFRQVEPAVIVSVNIPSVYAAIERMRRSGCSTPFVVMANHSVEGHYLAEARRWAHVLDAMVGVNRLSLRLAREFTALDACRLYYAPCGVQRRPRRTHDDRSGGPLRIGYSGRVETEQKRVQDLPRILDELDRLGMDYILRIAGGGPGEDQLRAELHSRSADGKVEFLGVLNADELHSRLYDWADGLLVTSFWETGPIVIWEAMAVGLPVVSSRYVGSGAEGALRDGENCLLFPIGDAGTAARLFRRLRDPQAREYLAGHAYSLVNERYSHEVSTAHWDRCFRAILQLRHPDVTSGASSAPVAGRLDRWLGPGLGETLRGLLGQSYRHTEPGGEWPHAISETTWNAAEFWERAKELDVDVTVGAESND